MSKNYVEYDSNNSGGSWWLRDDDWRALEKAGWKVQWYTLMPVYNEVTGDYVVDEDGTPKLVPANGKNFSAADKNGRWMGALASKAFKGGAVALRWAVNEWEQVTGQSATAAGCSCCGPPHRFTLYVNGKYAESGPTARYEASWD